MTFLPAAVVLSILLAGVIAEVAGGQSISEATGSIFLIGWIHFIAVPLAAVALAYAKAKMKGGDPAACDDWAKNIRSGALTNGYRRALIATLNAVDRHWSPIANPNAIVKTDFARAWSFDLLNFSLGVAVVYPFVLLVIQWAVSGEAVGLGSLEIIPANGDWLRRVTAIAALFAATLALLWNFPEGPASGRGAQEAKDLEIRRDGRSILKMFGGLAIAGAAIAASAGQGPVLAGLAAALVFATMASGAVAISVSFIVAVAPNVFLAFILTFGALITQYWIGQRTKRPTLTLLIYVLGLFILLAIVTGLTIERETAQAKLLILLGFLPILTAVFNFTSTGFTRHRLRVAVKDGTFGHQAFLDLAVSSITFVVLLAAALIAYSLLRDKSGNQLFDINEIFIGIRDRPSSYLWLYLTFAATLLPTLLHFSLTIATWFFTAYPSALKTLGNWVYHSKDRPELAVLVASAFGALAYLAIALPLLVFHSLYRIAVVFGLDIGRMLLLLLSQLAKAFGVSSIDISM